MEKSSPTHSTNQPTKDTNAMKLLFSRPEAAQSLALSVRSIDKLIQKGELKATRIGNAVRVHIDDLEAFAAMGSVSGTKTL